MRGLAIRLGIAGLALGIGLALMLIADAISYTQPPIYTPTYRSRIANHHCRSEDSYMFVPARRVSDNVYITDSNHVYCVQRDYTYRALRDR